MTAEPRLPWDAEDLRRRLQALLPGIEVQVLARTGSTNTRLLERARADLGRRHGDRAPCLLVAEQQTEGRGRNGRSWQSAAGSSLTFSLSAVLEPADWSGLSLAVGVALAEALEPQATAPRLLLKWPNDLWLADGADLWRKLGGVLIETLPVGPARLAVIGIGLNVLPHEMSGLAHGYACLQELDPAASAPAVLARVAEPLARALRRFEQQGFAAFADAFARRDLLRGRAVTTTLAAAPQGIADGVAADGSLRLRAGDQVHTVTGGEVSVRPAGAT